MSQPSHLVLRKLHNLDRSLTEYHNQLINILYGEEYARCVITLEGDELRWLVDHLDKACDVLPPFSPASRKCLRELRNICGTMAILPTSYTLSSNLTIKPGPFDAGGFGDVFRGTLDGSPVCIKRIRVYSNQDIKKSTKTFCREAVMWKHLKHPNIVPLLGITIEPSQLISSWMPGGDLLNYVKDSSADRLLLLSDVAEGLCYLHSCNVIHGDLKGQNILVDETGHARITDFGLAKVTLSLDSIRSATTHSSFTPRWTAPEVLGDGRHSKEADIFSFAMIMVEVFTGAIPFVEKTSTAAMFDIMNGKRPERPPHPVCTNELWTLMQCSWNQDSYSRPTVAEVLSVLRGADRPTWKCLISDTLLTHERVSLITTIFSDSNQIKMVNNLRGNEAQTFVDKISEVLDSLAPQTHRRCLRYLYGICGHLALLPGSLKISLCCDPTENPVSHGERADVWKGLHEGREVAARVFKLMPGDDFDKIKRRFCREIVTWRALYHPYLLPLLGVTMTENLLVVVSDWMPKGNIKEFTKANPNVNRLGLLRSVIRGLIYMHDQRIIHGDLKGVNILIDNDDNPRITGFNMVTMASEQSTIVSPHEGEGTIPWMSPELLYPENFGLKNNCPTMQSDVYALGMVIYEVLNGQAPFATYRDPEVVFMVLGGERPGRPQGDAGIPFTDRIWEVLELCWKQQPKERPSAKHVLIGLDGDTPLPWPPPDMDGDAESDTDCEQSAASTKSGPTTAGSSTASDSDDRIAPQRRHFLKGLRVGIALRKLFKR